MQHGLGRPKEAQEECWRAVECARLQGKEAEAQQWEQETWMAFGNGISAGFSWDKESLSLEYVGGARRHFVSCLVLPLHYCGMAALVFLGLSLRFLRSRKQPWKTDRPKEVRKTFAESDAGAAAAAAPPPVAPVQEEEVKKTMSKGFLNRTWLGRHLRGGVVFSLCLFHVVLGVSLDFWMKKRLAEEWQEAQGRSARARVRPRRGSRCCGCGCCK